MFVSGLNKMGNDMKTIQSISKIICYLAIVFAVFIYYKNTSVLTETAKIDLEMKKDFIKYLEVENGLSGGQRSAAFFNIISGGR